MEVDGNCWNIVKSQYPYLKDKLVLNLDKLCECDVISDEERQDLARKPLVERAAYLIRRILLKKVSEQFSYFMSYLEQSGQTAIVNQLNRVSLSPATDSENQDQDCDEQQSLCLQQKQAVTHEKECLPSVSGILSLNLAQLRQWCARLDITKQFSSVSRYRDALLAYLEERVDSAKRDDRHRDMWEDLCKEFAEKQSNFKDLCRKINNIKGRQNVETQLIKFGVPQMSYWLGPGEYEQLKKDVESGKPTLLVAGSTSAGKSTLINALLGENVLPTSYSVATSCLCEIQFSESKKYAVVDLEEKGNVTSVELRLETKEGQKKFEELMTNQSGKGRAFCKHSKIFWPSQFLKAVTIVDSPGVTEKYGVSLAFEITETFQRNQASGFIYVLDAQRSAEEAGDVGGLLSRISHITPHALKAAVFVLNKWDIFLERHPKEEYQMEYLKLIQQQLQSRLTVFKPDQLLKMNAKLALRLQCLGEISDDLNNLWKCIAKVLPVGLHSLLIKSLNPIEKEVEGIYGRFNEIVQKAALSERERMQQRDQFRKVLHSFQLSSKSGRLKEMTEHTKREIASLAETLALYLRSKEADCYALNLPDLQDGDNPKEIAESCFYHTLLHFPKFEKFVVWVESNLDPFVDHFLEELQKFKASVRGSQHCYQFQEKAIPCKSLLDKVCYGLSIAVITAKKLFSAAIGSKISSERGGLALHVEQEYRQIVEDACSNSKALLEHLENVVKKSKPAIEKLYTEIPNMIADAEKGLQFFSVSCCLPDGEVQAVFVKYDMLRKDCAKFRLQLRMHEHDPKDIALAHEEIGHFRTTKSGGGFQYEERLGRETDRYREVLGERNKTLDESTALENAQVTMERAFSHLGAPKVLAASDLVSHNKNQCLVMTYISCLKDARLRTDFKAFIDDRASVRVARAYHNAGTDEVMHAVLSAQDCDLDSLVSAIAHAYFKEQVNLKFDQTPSVLIPVFNANRHSISFCTKAIYLFDECNVTLSNVTCTDDVNLKALQTDGRLKLTLVNHNRLASHQTHFIPDVVEILDCHDDENEVVYEPTLPLWVEPSVACTATLIAECYLDQMPHLLEQNPDIVKLLLGIILYKMENLKEGRSTGERERKAAERLGKLTDVNQAALYDELERRGRDRKPFATAYDALRRDFKEADETPRDIRSGAALLHDEHVEEFLSRDDAGHSLARLVDEEKLGVLVVMSECRDALESVRCQLAVYGDNELAEKVAEYLQGREDLSMNSLPCRDKRIQFSSLKYVSQRDVVLAHVVAYFKEEKEMVPVEESTVSPEAPTSEVPPDSEINRFIDMRLIQPFCNVMWLSGHQNDTAVIICAACYLPDKGIPGYDNIMQHLYSFCYQFIKKLGCTKFIAVYLYGGTGGRNVDNFGWMRQWYFLLTRRFGGKIQNVYLLHVGFWIEKLLKITGLFMSRKLYEKLAFVSTIEELSQYVDTHQINFPQAVVEEDGTAAGREE